MDRMWGRPGAGAPLGREHLDFARKQKRKSNPGPYSTPKKKRDDLSKKVTVLFAKRWGEGGRWPPINLPSSHLDGELKLTVSDFDWEATLFNLVEFQNQHPTLTAL